MNEYYLNIGEVKTFDHPVVLTCNGLGSCIGLFLQDRTTGLSGGAHILLPYETIAGKQQGKSYSVRNAVEKLLSQFRQKGSLLNTLRAKIVGGANVLNISLNVGQQNAQSLLEALVENKIYVAAIDVGGKQCRTARFNSSNGQMYVRLAEDNHYQIY